MKKVLVVAVLLVVAWSGCAFAATMVDFNPYTTDLFAERPFLTENARTELGVFEMNAGYNMALFQGNTTTQSVRAHINYGVTKNMTLGICLPYVGGYDGVNNAQIGIKYSLNSMIKAICPKEGVLDAAMSYTFVPGSMDYALKLILGKDLDKVNFCANLGYIKHSSQKTSIVYSGAVNFLLSSKLNLGGEIVGEVTREGGVANLTNASLACKYWLTDSFNVDLGVGTTIMSGPALYGTAGFTWFLED